MKILIVFLLLIKIFSSKKNENNNNIVIISSTKKENLTLYENQLKGKINIDRFLIKNENQTIYFVNLDENKQMEVILLIKHKKM